MKEQMVGSDIDLDEMIELTYIQKKLEVDLKTR